MIPSGYSEDVNFHLQSLRDAPLPPIMYTGIFILDNRGKKAEEEEEEEEARERNNNAPPPNLRPSLITGRAVYTKGAPADRSTDKRTFHNAKLCRGRLNFLAPYTQKCLLIAASSSSPRDMT